jgi:hypothetical protein
VIPEVTRPSAGEAPQVTATPVSSTPGIAGWQTIGGALMLVALAAVVLVLRRRRSSGRVAVGAVVDVPHTPSAHPAGPATFDEVEIALRDLLAEARGQDLLVDAEGDTAAADAALGVVTR